MSENWDAFPVNVGETAGHIVRRSFLYNYCRFEVWQLGRCIYSANSNEQIVANVNNEILDVTIEDSLLNNHIVKHFSFGEISTLHDRVLWSKDIFNKYDRTESKNPDATSLFYMRGILAKVTFTIDVPKTLIEFYS